MKFGQVTSLLKFRLLTSFVWITKTILNQITFDFNDYCFMTEDIQGE